MSAHLPTQPESADCGITPEGGQKNGFVGTEDCGVLKHHPKGDDVPKASSHQHSEHLDENIARSDVMDSVDSTNVAMKGNGSTDGTSNHHEGRDLAVEQPDSANLVTVSKMKDTH